jgi:hypothetical protein
LLFHVDITGRGKKNRRGVCSNTRVTAIDFFRYIPEAQSIRVPSSQDDISGGSGKLDRKVCFLSEALPG